MAFDLQLSYKKSFSGGHYAINTNSITQRIARTHHHGPPVILDDAPAPLAFYNIGSRSPYRSTGQTSNTIGFA